MNDLREDFLKQAIETVDNLIARLADENKAENLSENFRREAFRALHTIKGTAQTFGFPQSGSLAHQLESLLSTGENKQENKQNSAENYKALFLEGLCFLRQTFEQNDFKIPAAFSEKICRYAPLENNSENFLSQIPAAIISQLSSREKNVVDSALRMGKNLFCLEIDFNLNDFAEGLTGFREVLSETGEIVATLPGAKFNHSDKIGFRILLTTSETPQNIKQIAEKRRAEIVFQSVREDFSNDLRGVFEQVKHHGENLVRQLGKKIDFEISIEDSLAKKEIAPKTLKLIFDALLHLIRNAVDHGVETIEERAGSGKKPRAQIKIEFSGGENNFLLSVADDGRSIDTEKIKAKAVEKHLIDERENPSEQALFDLIFAPEFSTAGRLTEISGRGVGLDAVKTAVEQAGGKITVKSRKGNGTTFEIYLPKEK